MEKMKLQVSGSQIQVMQRPAAITAGTVGLEAEFVFDSHWENLGKTVIFRAGDKVVTTALEGNTHIVPWEVLEKPDLWLIVGVYGANPDGTVVIPTLWTKVAAVYSGVDPEGDPALEPANPIWQETLVRVTNMEPQLRDHINNTDNPHGVTCGQIGAVTEKEFRDVVSNLDGSSDPEQLIPHLLNRDNPHGVTAAQAGAAPAGYGLGENSAASKNWGAIWQNGFFREAGGSPDNEMWYGAVFKNYGGIQAQMAFKNVSAGAPMTMAIRQNNVSSSIKPELWEYVNPPMLEGVEYRTTERHNGKPVYTMLVNFGALPNNSQKDVFLGVTNITVVQLSGMYYYTSLAESNIYVPFGRTSNISDFFADGTAGYIGIVTSSDMTTRSAFVVIKYTKD